MTRRSDKTSSTRLKGEKVDINEASVLGFFSERAQRYSDEAPLVSVLYQDKNPELAERRDEQEKAKVLPLLNLKGSETVLDIGCGIGRWVDILAGSVNQYIGIDADPGFIRIAKERRTDTRVQFHALGAGELAKAGFVEPDSVNLVIICGLFPYINDETAKTSLVGLEKKLAPGARIYLREPLGVKARFTLRNHWSEELQQFYSAIYRSRAEMLDLFSGALPGFDSNGFQPLFGETALNNRAETQQYFLIGQVN